MASLLLTLRTIRFGERLPHESDLQKLHVSCVNDMIKNICSVMGQGGSPFKKPTPDQLVYIAGVGAVSAVEYQNMYESGDAMCSNILTSCTNDWNSAQCSTARKIYLK